MGAERRPAGQRHPLLRALAGQRGALVMALVGALAFALTLELFYPGFMSRDSGNQLQQARDGLYTDHHPILMAVIWRFTDRLVPGPGGMLVIIAGVYWLGLTGIFWALPGPLPARALALLGVGSFLPSLCCVAAVWKDTLMHATMLAGVAFALAPLGGRWRWLARGLAVLFFLLAIGLRHNAAAAVWPLLVLLLLELPALQRRSPAPRLLLASLGALALTLVLTLGLRATLAPHAKATNFWQRAAAFDLISISLKIDEIVIDPQTGLLTPGMGLPEMRQQFRPDFNDTLYHCAYFRDDGCVLVFNLLSDEAQLQRLSRNWIRAIVDHPGAYLRHKWDMTLRLMRLGGLEPPRRYFYLSAAPFHDLARTYEPSVATLQRLDWMDLQQTWIGFSAWIYVLLSLALLPLTAFRYLRGAPPLPLLLVLSGLSYLLSVLLTAGGPDNRYTVWTIVCTLLALAALVLPALPALAARFRRARTVP